MQREQEQPETDVLAQLIRAAGRRENPSSQMYERALKAATEVWRKKTQQRRQRRVLVGSIAASVLIAMAAAGLFIGKTAPVPATAIAQFNRIIGVAEVRGPESGRWMIPQDESAMLLPGSAVRTSEGSRAGLALAGGVSLRLAGSTEIALESATRIRLRSGTLYLDRQAHAQNAEPLQVVTAVGTAADWGTQFEVRYREGVYRLRVREGRVVFSRGAEEIDAGAGDQLSIDSAGSVERNRVPAADAEWNWVHTVSIAPDVEDKPVTVLLAWVARETGRTLSFETPEVERKAAGTILHGSIRHLAPLEALSVMLATTDLEFVIPDDSRILVRFKSGASARR